MQSYDIYALIAEIKAEQMNMKDMLREHLERSQHKIHDLTELEQILHILERTSAKYIKEGKFPHGMVPGKIWITDEQLKMFLEQNNNNSDVNRKL